MSSEDLSETDQGEPSDEPQLSADAGRPESEGSKSSPMGVWVLLAVALFAGILVVAFGSFQSNQKVREQETRVRDKIRARRVSDPRRIQQANVTGWWDAVPDDVIHQTFSDEHSNIHPSDYAAPEDCKKCHEENYAGWSDHPHRWMNALAADATIKGDFSGQSKIEYYGGKATFLKKSGQYLMRLSRGEIDRTYQINQTIGSRFFQYYIGKQIVGPEPKPHRFYEADHVLPFGYWFESKEWVPVVHVGDELPDSTRPDPFAPIEDKMIVYAESCNFCHTTFAVGDMLSRQPGFVGMNSPNELHWKISSYLQQERPEMMKEKEHPADFSDEDLTELLSELQQMEAPDHAVTLGVSCGACHLGSNEHVTSGGKVMPKFSPASPHLFVANGDKKIDYSRSHDNVNWACGRCHIGFRPQYAAGMSTWNSVEYSDAMLGSCYSELRCIDCHKPHDRIGTKESPNWDHSASFDDHKCLSCHEKFGSDEARVAHTHHDLGSAGSRCMNCHMPRINEGLQALVRTHMIYSPTRADMIEANHPNACNMCHTDKSIDWTTGHLKDWYGADFSEGEIAASYPDRGGSVAVGWLKSENEAVRLVGADALIRTQHQPAMPHLLDALDDPFLINRQFASDGLSKWLETEFSDFGYRFYMRPDERAAPLKKIRAELLSGEQ